MKLDNKYVSLINDKSSLKVLSSVGKSGVVNSAVKQSLYVREDGKIAYNEFLETSETNKNLFFSLWFKKTVSILVVTKDHESYEIRGIPTSVIIEGAEFQAEYIKVQEKFDGIFDLGAIWIIDPVEVRSKDLKERFREQNEKYPIVTHLDRLAK